MKNYLITIIITSICVGIYNIISPQFKGVEKYSKMIGMLIVLCIIISPIKEIMDTFDEDKLDEIKDNIIDYENGAENGYDEIFNDYLGAFSIDELKKAIANILFDEFGIPNDECDISISTEYKDGKLTPTTVQILLSGKSIFKNPYTIEARFSELLDCGCVVLIK